MRNPFFSRVSVPGTEDAAEAVTRLRNSSRSNYAEHDASILFEFILKHSYRLNWLGRLAIGLPSLALGIFLGWWVGKL